MWLECSVSSNDRSLTAQMWIQNDSSYKKIAWYASYALHSICLHNVHLGSSNIYTFIYWVQKRDWHYLEYLVSLLQWNLACDILMTLAAECMHYFPPYLSYISILPDTVKKKSYWYAVFLSVVWVALKRTGFEVSEVALKRDIPLTSTWPHLRCDVGLE